MTVYIVGGSNSLIKDGWTRRLDTLVPEEKIRNISIGATNSITGLYRALFTVNLAAGDTILWEYALNDCNHVMRHGLSEGYLLRYLEVLLTECAKREVNFVAFLFRSRQQEAVTGQPSYHARLRELFDAWEISYADISEKYRAVLGVPVLPDSCFEAVNHYAQNDTIIDFIEEQALSLLGRRSVPVPSERRYSEPSLGVDFVDAFECGEAETIGTSWFTVAAGRPDPTLTLRGATDGTLVSAVMFAAPAGGAWKLSSGTQSASVSATLPGAGRKMRLSPAFFDSVAAPRFRCEANMPIEITWSEDRVGLISGSNNKRELSEVQIAGRDAAFVGLLVERPGGLGCADP